MLYVQASRRRLRALVGLLLLHIFLRRFGQVLFPYRWRRFRSIHMISHPAVLGVEQEVPLTFLVAD